MNSPRPAHEAAVLALGALVAADAPLGAVEAALAALPPAEADGTTPPFAGLVAALGLAAPAAACLALWLHSADAGRDIAPAELLRQLRRLGGQGEEAALAELFLAGEQGAVLRPAAAAYLAGRPPALEAATLTPPTDKPLLQARPLLEELQTLLANWLENPGDTPLVVALCGRPGSGRKFLLGKLAQAAGAPLMVVRGAEGLEDALFAARLYGALVCVTGAGWRALAARMAAGLGLVFAAVEAEEAAPAPDDDFTLLRREMPPMDAEARRRALENLLAGVPLAEGADPAGHMQGLALSIGQLAALAGTLAAEALAACGPVGDEALARALRQVAAAPLYGAQLMRTEAGPEALALPAEQMRRFTELCGYARLRERVFGDWHFGDKLAYGRGLSALFYGAPGTGKTLAATVLAREAGLPLYRVDLAQLISKYIGETQKNIGRVFDEAAHSGGILFFDEADALFTRRSEAGEAQDKYANAEIAYLLQRTEQHDGIVLLATNLLQNFDEAFRRRIGFMLHFPLPDAGLRKRIWQGIFPPQAPVQGLDLDFLAAELELSGAGIKNCAVHAAYAAALADGPIGMAQVLRAAREELAKQGKALGIQAAQQLAALEA